MYKKIELNLLGLVIKITIKPDYYYFRVPPKYYQHYHWVKKAWGLRNRYDRMIGKQDDSLDTLPF
jgi:hypothetical protein